MYGIRTCTFKMLLLQQYSKWGKLNYFSLNYIFKTVDHNVGRTIHGGNLIVKGSIRECIINRDFFSSEYECVCAI